MFLRKTAVLLFCFFFSIAVAVSANGADLKIGILDIQKVLVGSEAGKEAKIRFEKKKEELEANFQKEQEVLKKLKDEIEKKSSVWSKEKKDEKVLEFNKMRRDLKTKGDDSRMEMKRLQDKELEPIIKTLEKVVDEYGKKNEYSLILDSKSGVIFAGEALDISEAIIADLNKAMK